MKRLILLIFIIVILLPTEPVFSLNSQKDNSVIIIDVHNEDITGDGIQETIELKGTLLSKDSPFYHNIWVDISNEHSGEWRINYGGGYYPNLQTIDLNSKYKTNLLFTSSSDESKTDSSQKLHSIQNNKVIELKLPKPNIITGTFKENFKLEVKSSPYNKGNIYPLTDSKHIYIQKGIYNDNGRLKRKQKVNTSSHIFFEPFFISTRKGYGLKSVQNLHDNNNNVISAIETIWYFENNKWVNLQEKLRDN